MIIKVCFKIIKWQEIYIYKYANIYMSLIRNAFFLYQNMCHVWLFFFLITKILDPTILILHFDVSFNYFLSCKMLHFNVKDGTLIEIEN